jgi:hypothetical protein
VSPILLPDTSKAEDMDPSVAGTYQARVVQMDGQLSREKKVPQAVIQVVLEAPREDNQEVRKIRRYAWLNTEGAGSMGFDQFLRACKESEVADRIRSGEKVPINTDDFDGRAGGQGKELLVVLKVGTFKGNRKDEIDGFLPA